MHVITACTLMTMVYIAAIPETTMQIDSIGYSYVATPCNPRAPPGGTTPAMITSDIPELSLEPAMADNIKDTTKSFILLFYNTHEDQHFFLLLHTEPYNSATAVI